MADKHNITPISDLSALTISTLTDVFDKFGNELSDFDISRFEGCEGPYDKLEDLFEIIIKFYISHGKRISDLPIAKEIFDNDLLLISKLSSDTQYQSNSTTFDDLEKNLVKHVIDSLSVGSMAFESKYRYSSVDHLHDGKYCLLSGVSLCAESPNTVKICELELGQPGSETLEDSNVLSIYAPVFEFNYDAPTPYEIGSLKFVYIKEGQECYTNSQLLERADFDGWLYPNGDTLDGLDADKFKDALEVYGTDVEGQLKLPNLSSYFKCCNHATSNYEVLKPSQLSYVKHQHDVDPISISGTLSIDNSKKLYNYGGKVHKGQFINQVHNGPSTTPASIKFTINLPDIEITDLSTVYNEPNPQRIQNFQPKHQCMPVMVYVGGVDFYASYH